MAVDLARRLAAAIALLLGLSGCMGYLRPILLQDGREVYLVLSTYSLDGEDDRRTLIFRNRSGGAGQWQRMADRAGAARAAAAWEGELWLFYPTICSPLRPDGEDLSSRVVAAPAGFEVQAAAAHEKALWVFGVDGSELVCRRRLPGNDSWEAVPGGLFLGTEVTQMNAVSAGDRLWLLWRKRAADGRAFPETFSASWRDGEWTALPARDIGRGGFAAAADPGGRGVLVAAGGLPDPGRPALLPHRSPLVLYRLDDSGWTDLPATGATWRESLNVLLAPAMLTRPAPGEEGPAEVLSLRGGNGVLGVQAAPIGPEGSSGPWSQSARLPVEMLSPQLALIPGLFLASLLVGSGLGMLAVRRRRFFPLPPAQPRPAPLLPRGAAWLVDNLLLGLVLYAVVHGSGLTMAALFRDARLLLLALGTYRLLFLVYGWVFEARWGATPGKLLFGLRLSDDSGHRPSARAALIRNLLRLVDELGFFPMPGLLLMAASRLSRRLGDMAAGTTVTTAEALAEVHDDRHRKSDRFGLPR